MKAFTLVALVIVVVTAIHEADCYGRGRGSKSYKHNEFGNHFSHGSHTDFKHRPDCGCPPTPENGDVVDTTYQKVKVIKYKCREGFVMEGADTSTCQADGTWGNVDSTCKRSKADCGVPNPPTNGNVSGTNYLEEDVVTFSCRMGFVITGNITSTCQNNGTWSNTKVTCRADCGKPKSPTNGYVTGISFLEDDIVYFECDEDYELEGNYETRCQHDGKWSNEDVSCKAEQGKTYDRT